MKSCMGESNNWIALHPVSPHAFQPGFLSAFCPSGGKMRLYRLLGGGGGGDNIYSCVKHVASRVVWGHARLGNFYFGPFIRHNLVESGTVFTQT